jgi:hypothetical protein
MLLTADVVHFKLLDSPTTISVQQINIALVVHPLARNQQLYHQALRLVLELLHVSGVLCRAET